MSSGWLDGLRRFVLWDHRRGSWQYDVIVGLILAFIFLTPRHWFHDQPKPKSVVLLPSENGNGAFWIDPELLSGLSEADRFRRAEKLIQSQTGGRKRSLAAVKAIYDEQQELKGFMAFVRP